MNGDDMLRALEAKRAEIDTAIGELRHVLAVLTGPTLPASPPVLHPRKAEAPRAHRKPGTNGHRTSTPADLADRIVTFVAGQAAPVAKAEIAAGVRGATYEHIQTLVKSGRLVGTGYTTARRYSIVTSSRSAVKPADGVPAVVWDGTKGGSLSGYQQKAKG